MTRRVFLPTAAATPLAMSAARKGRLKQSVCRWCYKDIPLEDLARESAKLGLKGMDLIGPDEWPVVKKYGLTPAMTTGGGTIPDGLNRKENHDKIEKQFRENIPRAAAAGVPNVITFSGNRRGQPDAEGADNCVIGLNRVKAIAEEHGVTICLELLNSKVNHKDYQCDHTAWGVDVIKRVNSPRVKLLYDIYHMQIMEGDVRTPRARRHAGAELSPHRRGDRRAWIPGLLRPRICPHARSIAEARRSGRFVRRVDGVTRCSAPSS
jgi:hydroxypyruvate isomerase